jgi:hypothetical protein
MGKRRKMGDACSQDCVQRDAAGLGAMRVLRFLQRGPAAQFVGPRDAERVQLVL